MQAPSTVNDCARLMMSTLRIQMQDAQWFDWGFTCTRIAGNKFSMRVETASATTSVLSKFLPGSRMKLYDTSTMYATITETSQSSSTINITVTMDAGSLTNSFTSAYLSIISPINSALPTGASGASPFDNLLVNSDFQVAQLGTSFTSVTTPANNDDTYLFDQWILLSDGNDIVDVSQDTTNTPTGAWAAIKLDVETANKKFGLLQPLENKISANGIGGVVSVSFTAKKEAANATFETLRAAIISWDGTADTITSDVVSAWGAAGTNPTLVANWTYENVATNLTLTSAFQTFTINSIPVDTASTKNIALFIWCDDADATVGDIAYISKFKVEVAEAATSWEQKPINLEILACQRYLWKSFPQSVAPAQGGGIAGSVNYSIYVAGVATITYFYPFGTPMITTPHTITYYNPVSANAKWYNANVAADSGTASSGTLSDRGIVIVNVQVAGDLVAGTVYVHFVADARL